MNDLEAQYRYYECVIRLHELEYDFEIRGNGQNYTKGEHGRFTGSKPAGGSGKVSSNGLTNGTKNGTIKTDKILYTKINEEIKQNSLINPEIGVACKPAPFQLQSINIHAQKQLEKRGITVDDAQRYIDTAVISFIQSEDKVAYYSYEGASVVKTSTKSLLTSFSSDYFDSGAKEIIKVAKKYGL